MEQGSNERACKNDAGKSLKKEVDSPRFSKQTQLVALMFLNAGHPACEAGILPTELRALSSVNFSHFLNVLPEV